MKEPLTLKRQVGENIRSLRKSRGLSQEDLGEKADLSYKFVGEIERGTVNPSLDSLARIANALNVEVAKLFLYDDMLVLSGEDVIGVRAATSTLDALLSRN